MKARIEKKLSKRLVEIAPTIFRGAWLDIKADLLRRGECESDGGTVVNLGNGLWCRLKDTLSKHSPQGKGGME